MPDVWQDFDRFAGLSNDVLENLRKMEANAPTPIQMQAASIIHQQRDLLACAPTGSGKTLAFLLPLLLRSLQSQLSDEATKKGPRAVVLEPTRELARQVFTEAGKIRRGIDWSIKLLGDDKAQDDEMVGSRDDEASLLVTTPLRLVYAVKQGEVDLSR